MDKKNKNFFIFSCIPDIPLVALLGYVFCITTESIIWGIIGIFSLCAFAVFYVWFKWKLWKFCLRIFAKKEIFQDTTHQAHNSFTSCLKKP